MSRAGLTSLAVASGPSVFTSESSVSVPKEALT